MALLAPSAKIAHRNAQRRGEVDLLLRSLDLRGPRIERPIDRDLLGDVGDAEELSPLGLPEIGEQVEKARHPRSFRVRAWQTDREVEADDELPVGRHAELSSGDHARRAWDGRPQPTIRHERCRRRPRPTACGDRCPSRRERRSRRAPGRAAAWAFRSLQELFRTFVCFPSAPRDMVPSPTSPPFHRPQ